MTSTAEIPASLAAKGLLPSEHFVDSAYVDGALLVSSRRTTASRVRVTKLAPELLHLAPAEIVCLTQAWRVGVDWVGSID